MTAMDDFIMGTSPQIDPQMCKNARIGYDRVWRTAVELLHVMRPGGRIYMSYATLAERLGIHIRTARTAVYVLEESGVLQYVDKDYDERETIQRMPAWTPSVGRLLDLDIRTVHIRREDVQEARVGVDRAWRLSVLWKALKTRSTAVLGAVTGIGVRQIRRALSALGLKTSRTASHTPKWSLRRKKKGADPRTQKRHSSQRNTSYSSSTRAERGRRLRWAQKIIFGGHIMPYEVMRELDNVVLDESQMRTKDLQGSDVAEAMAEYEKSRRGRPSKDWTALDIAREFKKLIKENYPTAPGDLGDTVQLAKILGRLRKEYGHDGRVEYEILTTWINDATDIAGRNQHVPVWKKFLKAIHTHYRKAEATVVAMEAGHVKPEEAYVDSEARFNRNRKPSTEPSKLSAAAAADEQVVLALLERMS